MSKRGFAAAGRRNILLFTHGRMYRHRQKGAERAMNHEKKQPKKPAQPKEALLSPEVLAEIWQAPKNSIPTDVLGSYTGTGLANEQPEQDADDL